MAGYRCPELIKCAKVTYMDIKEKHLPIFPVLTFRYRGKNALSTYLCPLTNRKIWQILLKK